MTRLLSLLTSLVVIAAVSAGVAFAADYGHGGGYHGSKGQKNSRAKSHGGKRWRQYKDLEVTKAAEVAYLTGKAEVSDDGEPGQGDRNAKGSAIFHLVGGNALCYGFTLRGAGTPTNVHIHKGRAGHNGDPVIDFSKNPPKNAAGEPSGNPGASSGCKVLTQQSEIAALKRIKAHPSRYYANFHTTEFPDGAVRGQLGQMRFDND